MLCHRCNIFNLLPQSSHWSVRHAVAVHSWLPMWMHTLQQSRNTMYIKSFFPVRSYVCVQVLCRSWNLCEHCYELHYRLTSKHMRTPSFLLFPAPPFVSFLPSAFSPSHCQEALVCFVEVKLVLFATRKYMSSGNPILSYMAGLQLGTAV